MVTVYMEANEIMWEMGITSPFNSLIDIDDAEEKLEEVVRQRIERVLSKKQMQKMHEWYTDECNMISRRVQKIAWWGSKRTWDTRAIQLLIVSLLDGIAVLIRNFCVKYSNAQT